MNKTGLVAALRARQPWMRTSDALQIIDAIFDPDDGIIAASLEAGDAVHVTDFGTFDVAHVPMRDIAAPPWEIGTGSLGYQVPAHRRVTFRAGRGLKARVYE